MYTDVIIANMALGHVGTAELIESLQSDTNPNAKACLRFYRVAVRHTLRAFSWSFARRTGLLSKLDAPDQSIYQWRYRYQYPPDAVKFLKIVGDVRNESRDTRVPYRRFSDGIYTDRNNAVGIWIAGNITENFYDDDFALALSYKLAALISSTVTRGDDFKKGEEFQLLFDKVIAEAEAASANEEQEDVAPASEFERARL